MRRLLPALALPVLAAAALALGALGDEPPAAVQAAEYCVTQGPVAVGGSVVFAGGKYCVPGP